MMGGAFVFYFGFVLMFCILVLVFVLSFFVSLFFFFGQTLFIFSFCFDSFFLVNGQLHAFPDNFHVQGWIRYLFD